MAACLLHSQQLGSLARVTAERAELAATVHLIVKNNRAGSDVPPRTSLIPITNTDLRYRPRQMEVLLIHGPEALPFFNEDQLTIQTIS